MNFLEKLPLEINSSRPLFIREEKILLSSSAEPIYSILYISDIHFSDRDGVKRIDQILETVQQAKPDLVLFGGDLVDNRKGILTLRDCVRNISHLAPLASVSGNHDHSVGVKEVKKAVLDGGGTWLEDKSISLCLGGKPFRIEGKLKKDDGNSATRILCSHFPSVFPKAVDYGYRLVLAGHLHGCQFVFWQKGERLFPGAWFYQWNGLRFQEGPCSLLVSRGVSDSVPIRWNCPREVLLCKIY
jgi:predicted MPP superfamily phosphohydrolase